MARRAALMAVLLVACGRVDVESPDITAPFVVFAQPNLIIERLGVAVPAPVTVGSTASPALLMSDAPDVVSVGPGGALTAHRNGTATIRTADARGTLLVEVRATSAIAIEPADNDLAPGDRVALRLRSADGHEIDPATAHWYTEKPNTAIVSAGVLEALAGGSTQISARYGGLTATAQVRVKRQHNQAQTIPANASDRHAR